MIISISSKRCMLNVGQYSNINISNADSASQVTHQHQHQNMSWDKCWMLNSSSVSSAARDVSALASKYALIWMLNFGQHQREMYHQNMPEDKCWMLDSSSVSSAAGNFLIKRFSRQNLKGARRPALPWMKNNQRSNNLIYYLIIIIIFFSQQNFKGARQPALPHSSSDSHLIFVTYSAYI